MQNQNRETFTFQVPLGVLLERADKVVARRLPEYSRAQLQKSFEQGLVFADGRSITKKEKISEEMEIKIDVVIPEKKELVANKMALDILFEDEYLMAINKDSGVVVHPGTNTDENTLVHGILSHCGDSLLEVGARGRPGIIHRLDKETSGVILIAKTDLAHKSMSYAFKNRKLKKQYLALVGGIPRLTNGVIEKPIDRHPSARTKMAVVVEGGRDARTDWELIAKNEDLKISFLNCILHTGRTHQIRVHLSNMGNVVLGDKAYGFNWKQYAGLVCNRVMLHSHTLEFMHPVKNETVLITAPFPEDFIKVAEFLGFKGSIEGADQGL